MTCSRIDLHHSRNAFSKHVTGLDQGDGEELVLGLLRVTKEVFLLSLAKLGGCLLQALLVVFVELRSALDCRQGLLLWCLRPSVCTAVSLCLLSASSFCELHFRSYNETTQRRSI